MKKIAFLLASVTLLTACNEDDNNSGTPVLTDRELINADTSFDIVNELDWALANEAAYENDGLRAGVAVPPQCATVDVVNGPNSGFPLVVIMDYGTTGCETGGVTRREVMKFTLSAPLYESGSLLTIERENYYVNNFKVDGTLTYNNTTTNPNFPQWMRTVTTGMLTGPNGQVYLHSGTRTVRMAAGASTPAIFSDNVFEITSGSHTVAKQGGGTLNVAVEETLVKQATCFYVSQGVLALQGDYLNGALNFGNGTCDSQAVYTHVNGETHQINL